MGNSFFRAHGRKSPHFSDSSSAEVRVRPMNDTIFNAFERRLRHALNNALEPFLSRVLPYTLFGALRALIP